MQKLGLFVTSLILSGCLAAQDDLDGYFDSVDPSPTIRTTTAPPLPAPAPSSGSQITTATLPTGDRPTTTVATDPNNTQTAGDRRLINTSAAPPPELVDNPVAAPAEASSPRVDPATVDTSVKALGTRTQTIDLREYARSQRHLVGEKKYARNPARSVEIGVSGSGDATVWATDTLNVNISGSGSVGYYGSPRTSLSGSARSS